MSSRSDYERALSRELIAAAIGLLALLAAVPSLWAATRVRPTVPGDAGDLFDDLGPPAQAVRRSMRWS
jgi:hypothetical protein